MFAGALRSEKGVVQLAQAFSKLAAGHGNAFLAIAGGLSVLIGWHARATVPLDRQSKFVYHWKPPRANVPYRVRLAFHDPHPYHADRESAILTVTSR